MFDFWIVNFRNKVFGLTFFYKKNYRFNEKWERNSLAIPFSE